MTEPVTEHALPRQRRAAVRTTTVFQMDATDAGPAALATMLEHFGRAVPLTDLRSACAVGRDGATPVDLTRVAEQHGLTAQQLDAAACEQLDQLAPPFISGWEQGRYVVVEGFDGDRAYVNDPSSGRTSMPRDEFAASRSGPILLLSPGPDFKRRRSVAATVTGLAHRLRATRAALVLILLTGLALSILTITTAVVLQLFVNQVLVAGLHELVVELVVALAGILVLTVAGTWLQQMLLVRLSAKLSLRMTAEFMWHLLRLPTSFYAQRAAGGLVSRVEINDSVAQLLAGPAASASIQLITVVLVLVAMLVVSPILTAVAVVIAGVNFLVLWRSSRQRGDAGHRVANQRYELNAATFGAFGQIETVKASGTENEMLSRLTGPQARFVNATQEQGAAVSALSQIPTFLTTLNTIAILGLGAFLVIEGTMTIGAVMAFQFLVSNFLAPIGTLVWLAGSIQDARAQIAQLDDVLDSPADPLLVSPRRDPTLIRRPRGRLELRDVTFGFATHEPPLMSRLSFSIEPGARLALVGGSGSGKSTVGALAAGLLQPWSGQILIDGRDLMEWPRDLVTASMAYVTQKSFLFEGSIRDNLVMWDPTVTDRAVRSAAADAEIDAVIERLPGSYDSPIRNGGATFSGGQRQRLAIARALAVDPVIAILDEATSALDPVTEHRIDQALRRRGMTCLIIAHRLSTIRDCDEILVLDNGAIVERGTHDDLLAADGRYAELVGE